MTGGKLVLMALALATTAIVVPGGDGGLVKWKHDPQKAMNEARSRGAGMMLYFTSEG